MSSPPFAGDGVKIMVSGEKADKALAPGLHPRFETVCMLWGSMSLRARWLQPEKYARKRPPRRRRTP
jgi:hypothetical protein